jgi:hypothetical protein
MDAQSVITVQWTRDLLTFDRFILLHGVYVAVLISLWEIVTDSRC